jgi:hypothetical protein
MLKQPGDEIAQKVMLRWSVKAVAFQNYNVTSTLAIEVTTSVHQHVFRGSQLKW